MDFNLISAIDKMADIAIAAGESVVGLSDRSAASVAPKAVRRLTDDLDMIANISDAAATRGKTADFKNDIEALVQDASEDIFRTFNPRASSPANLRAIYAQCWSSDTLELIEKLKAQGEA